MDLTYGFTSEDDVKKNAEAMEKVFEMYIETGPYMILDMWPYFRFFVPSIKAAYNHLLQHMNDCRDVYKGFTERRKKEYDAKNPKIFIDHMINLIGKSAKIGPGKSGKVSIISEMLAFQVMFTSIHLHVYLQQGR